MSTPLERHGDLWVKRDDLFDAYGAPGGKARTCLAILKAQNGYSHQQLELAPPGARTTAITASSRHSPQAIIVARIAQGLELQSRVHVPWARGSTAELEAAAADGAEIVEHRPGYNSVIVARARADAAATPGAVEVPFGMECWEAVLQTCSSLLATGVPDDVRRVVVPVGSGMTLAGVLHGLDECGLELPVLGVRVGADPLPRLRQYTTPAMLERLELVDAGVPYGTAVSGALGDVLLDPIYEAKCLPFLEPHDLFWVVGIRATLL